MWLSWGQVRLHICLGTSAGQHSTHAGAAPLGGRSGAGLGAGSAAGTARDLGGSLGNGAVAAAAASAPYPALWVPD